MKDDQSNGENCLANELADIVSEIRTLRETFDELNTAIEWGVRNLIAHDCKSVDLLTQDKNSSPTLPIRFSLGAHVDFEFDQETLSGEIVEFDHEHLRAMVWQQATEALFAVPLVDIKPGGKHPRPTTTGNAPAFNDSPAPTV